jgi:LemA protein
MKNKTGLIIGAIVVLLLIWGVSSYNGLIKLDEGVTKQWAQVENQLQRRYDLIPNLVNTVKGNTAQEKQVFSDLADARARYAGAATPDERANAASQVESGLARLLVIVENYPELKSSKAFQDLMVSLEGTENRIAVERGKYNEMVGTINTKIKFFPTSLVANMAGIDAREYFAVGEEAKVNPTVNFE